MILIFCMCLVTLVCVLVRYATLGDIEPYLRRHLEAQNDTIEKVWWLKYLLALVTL